MNDKQIYLLHLNNYEILSDIGFIIEKNIQYPNFLINFNPFKKEFELTILIKHIFPEQINNISQEFKQKINLIQKLNNIKE